MDRFIKAALASAILLLPTYALVQEQTPTSDTPLAQAIEFHKYFNMPENRVKIQFPSSESLYAWQHLSQYYPTAAARGGAISELEVSIDESIGKINFKGRDGVERTVSQHFEDMPLDAMLVLKDGKIVYERYKTMTPDTAHITMSCSKTFSSTLLAMLEDEGKVNLDDMTSKYVPALQGSAWDEIPVWATATMSPGLDFEETMVSIIAPGSWINNFHHTFLGEYDIPYIEQLRTVKRHPSGEKPGDPKSYRYSSANPLVLQLICEAVEKKPFGTLLQERVWEKAGFRNPMQLHLAPDGMGVGYGMMSTTPEDMLRFAMLHTPSWNKVASERIVTDEMDKIYRSTARVQTYEGSVEQGYNLDWFGHPPKSQGVMWDCVFEDGAMFKHGNLGQGIYVDPKRDFCAMGFGIADNNSGIDYAPGFMRAAAKMLNGE